VIAKDKKIIEGMFIPGIQEQDIENPE